MGYNSGATNRMAFSFQPLSPLANVAPISLGGLDISQIRPITPFAVGNPRSELIAQGIASGVKDISSGVLSGVKAAREQKLQDLKDQRELARDVMKLQASKAEKEISMMETQRHNKEMERLSQERIKEVTTPEWGGISSETTSTDSVVEAPKQIAPTPSSPPTQERYQRDTPPVGGFSFDSINLPEVPEEDPSLIKTDKILGDLTAPMPLEAAPTPMGDNAMNALANVDWSSVRASLGAGNAMETNIPQTMSTFASAKPPASIATLGGISNTGLANIEKELAAMPLQGVAPVTAQLPVTKYSVPRSGFNTYEEARKYMETQADNPNWYAAGTPEPNKQGKFVIPWKQNDPALRATREEAQKTREEAQKTREATAKSTEVNRMENTILREAKAFGMQKPVANFLRAGGTKELMMPFISAYENSNKYPEAAGQAEVDMVDLLGRAMSGGKITVGQTQLIENAMSLKDKYLTKFKGKAFGGGFLPEPIKQQMVRTFTETYNYGADAANKVVTATRDRLANSGIPAEKAGVYYFSGGHTTQDEVMLKSDALKRIKGGREEIAKLITEKASANSEEADIINKKIEAIKNRAKILHDRMLEEADVDSLLLGAKALQDRNVKEGFGGGDVGQIEVVPQ